MYCTCIVVTPLSSLPLQEGRPCHGGAASPLRAPLAGHDLPGAAGRALRLADLLQVPQHRVGRHTGAHGLHRILLQERGGESAGGISRDLDDAWEGEGEKANICHIVI